MPNAGKTQTRRGTIQSVDRAARILEALASGPRRLGVSQLADQLGLSRPTVHGLLQTPPAHGSALGKAMLAFAPEGVLAELLAEPLPKLTNRTLSGRALEAELATVREQGVAREREEAVLGESSIAAPITDHAGHAVGAIGVVGETAELLPRGPAKGVVAAVTEAARAISRGLGAGG